MTAGSKPFRDRRSVSALLETMRPDEHYPWSAMIEVADRCNEACIHCYQVQGQKGELTTEEWKRVIDELAEMGVLLLTISGGEATLRHDLLEIVEHARARSFAVKLFTNGLRVTPEMATRLGELGLMEAQLSLYSPRAEEHDRITRVPGSFEKTLAAARLLRDVGVAVVLKAPLMASTAHEIDAYVELVRGVGVDYQLDPTLDPREDGDANPERLRVSDAQYLEALRHPELARPRPPRVARDPTASVCGACSGNVHIEPNGEMRPCTQLQVPVGHALREGVRAAWRADPTARQIRETSWQDLPGCRECALQASCGRCFAVARVEVGDALAPYPSACRRARSNYQLTTGVVPTVRAGERDDVELGPYREVGSHTFETIRVRLDAADHARRAEQAWIRPPASLVQIRRRTELRADLRDLKSETGSLE